MAAVGGAKSGRFDNKENSTMQQQQQQSRKRPFQEEDDFIEEDFDLEPPEDDEADMLPGDLDQVRGGMHGCLPVMHHWCGCSPGSMLLVIKMLSSCLPRCSWTKCWARRARTGRAQRLPCSTLPRTA
jgi:hypothetical protein